MKFGLSFGHLCVAITLGLLLLLGQSPTEAKALRTYTGQQRQLEDYAGDDAVQGDDAAQGDDNAGDDAAEEEEQQEQDQEEEGEEDDEDNENYADGQYDSNGNDFNDASTGEGMFDTSPRNWGGFEWFLITAVFLAWGALTSCFCDAWWCCTCFKVAEQKIYENRKLPSVIKDPVSNPAESYAAMK